MFKSYNSFPNDNVFKMFSIFTHRLALIFIYSLKFKHNLNYFTFVNVGLLSLHETIWSINNLKHGKKFVGINELGN